MKGESVLPAQTSSKRLFYHHIDLLRFLFSVLIVYYHLLHANMMPYVTDPAYSYLAARNNYASNVVVCFFILSGVFLYQSFLARPEQGIFDYIVSRVVRLWPVMMVSMISEAFLSGRINWSRTLVNAFFLQCSGISLEIKGLLWYVSAFFFASVFLYSILRSFSFRKALLLISIIVYFICVFLVNRFNGKIGGRETVFQILNIGVLRGVAFIGVGILVGVIHQRLAEMTKLAPLSKPSCTILFFVMVITEFFCLRFLYRYFLEAISPNNHIVLVLVFSLLLMCLLQKNDPLGFLLNRKVLGFCGKYAYSIYVMQGPSFLILEKTLWRNQVFVANVSLALIISTLFPTVIGIAVYHLVEQPCNILFRKWYRRYRDALENVAVK